MKARVCLEHNSLSLSCICAREHNNENILRKIYFNTIIKYWQKKDNVETFVICPLSYFFADLIASVLIIHVKL